MFPKACCYESRISYCVEVALHAQGHDFYPDCCLVDTLRALGVKVDYAEAGPFTIRQGNRWLESFGLLGCLVS